MATTNKIPTSADIYLMVGNKKVAVVQSYKVTATRGGKPVLAFGQTEPVATIGGVEEYILELSRLYATDSAIKDGIDFFNLSDFEITIEKNGTSVAYTGCQWVKLEESAEVGGTILEKVTVSATQRVVVLQSISQISNGSFGKK